MARKSDLTYGELPLCSRYNPKAAPKIITEKSKGKTYTYYQVHVGWVGAKNERKRPKYNTLEEARLVVKKTLAMVEAERLGDQKLVRDVATSHEIKAAEERLAKYGVSISEAADFYIRTHDQIQQHVTVSEAWEYWKKRRQPHDEKRGIAGGPDAVAPVTFKKMGDTYVGPFVKEYGERRLLDLKQSDFEHWLFNVKTNVKNSMKKVHKKMLSTFLNWCADQKLYSKNLTPLKEIKIGNDPIDEKEDFAKILHPEVVRSMLDYALEADDDYDFYTGIVLVFRFFVGPRVSEVLQIKWGFIRKSDGVISLPAQRTKKHKGRKPTIPENARRWLDAFFARIPDEEKEDKTQFIIRDKFKNQLTEDAQVTRFQKFRVRWKEWAKRKKRMYVDDIETNAPRDSFGSYGLLVLGQNKTFDMMGERDFNTFYNHYHNMAEEKVAQAYFKLMPFEKPVIEREPKKVKKGGFFESEKKKSAKRKREEISVERLASTSKVSKSPEKSE